MATQLTNGLLARSCKANEINELGCDAPTVCAGQESASAELRRCCFSLFIPPFVVAGFFGAPQKERLICYDAALSWILMANDSRILEHTA
jgi:hypothetical protein